MEGRPSPVAKLYAVRPRSVTLHTNQTTKTTQKNPTKPTEKPPLFGATALGRGINGENIRGKAEGLPTVETHAGFGHEKMCSTCNKAEPYAKLNLSWEVRIKLIFGRVFLHAGPLVTEIVRQDCGMRENSSVVTSSRNNRHFGVRVGLRHSILRLARKSA